ncbi:MobF family relaxase [Pantoea agglomerans]|uniref:MobF family relaxase n=1 Tax=Enterobacter agglomerans TaxID=549 RepID=UPI003C7B54DF
MMSVQTLTTSSGAAGYYSQADNYYFVGELLTAWHGKLAEELGLSGSVDLKTFSNLLDGKMPDGRSMGKNHRPGLDLTFSAPKSLSILSLVGGDHRLTQAFQESVHDTIKEIESFISTRITKNKQTSIETTGKGVFASFVHDTSRNLDPQLHMHIIAMNVTEKDGKLYSLSSDKRYGNGFMELIYTHHTLFGTIQRNILEKKVTALGYQTRPTEKGLWEITGVPVNLLGHFSSRSRDIARAAGKDASFASRSIAALDTRSPKQVPDRSELLTEWNNAIREHGFDMGEFISESKAQAQDTPTLSQGDVTPVRIGDKAELDAPAQENALDAADGQEKDTDENAPAGTALEQGQAEPGPAGPEQSENGTADGPAHDNALDARDGPEQATDENAPEGTALERGQGEPDSTATEESAHNVLSGTPALRPEDAARQAHENGKATHGLAPQLRQKQKEPEEKARNPEQDDRVINTALSALSNRKRDFSYNEVVLEMAASTDNVVSLRDGERLIDRAIDTGKLIPLNDEKNRFTSQSLLIDEKVVTELTRDHMTSGLVSGKKRPLENALPELADSPVILVSAPSTVRGVKAVIDAVIGDQADRGRSVTVLSPTANRRDQIAFASDEKMIFRDLSNPDTAFIPNSTVIVDNAERMSARDAINLLGHAREHNLQLVLVNTSARSSQTNVLSLFKDGGATTEKVHTDHESLSVKITHAPDKTQRGKELASEYAAAFGDKIRPVVVAPTPLDRRQLTDEIRVSLKESGAIDGIAQGIWVETRNEVFMTIAEKKKVASWRNGYVIEDRTERKPQVFTVGGISEDTKSLILYDEKGEKSVVKASAMGRKDVRVFESSMIEVVAGEVLKASAAIKAQGITAKDSLRVHEASERQITGINERTGRAFTLYTHEPVYAAYGYVSGMGEVNRAEGTVLAALSKRDLNANNINSLNMSGNNLSIYSPLDEKTTVSKIQNMNLRNTVTEYVISTAQQPDIDAATSYLKEHVATPMAIAVNRAVAGVQEVSVYAATLLNSALKLDRRLSASEVMDEIDSRIASGDLISLNGGTKTTENPRLVPRAIYEVEKDILGMVSAGHATKQPLVMGVDADKLAHLTAGQRSATDDILTGTDTFQFVQGYAGVGKTTKLSTLQTVLNETLPQLEIRGIGPTHRAVGEMAGAGITAQTAKSFVLEALKDEAAGVKHDYRNTLFIIDEASMVGNSDMRDTLGLIDRAGGRAVVIGDRQQFLPIESGAPFQLAQERTPARLSVMQDIVRQTNLPLREAVYSTINGDHSGSLRQLEAIRNDIVPRREEYRALPQFSGPSLQGKATSETVALDYLSRTDEARGETLVITGTNKVRREINSLIQKGLVQDGSLSDTRHVSVPVYSQILLPSTAFHDPDTWEAGRVVINDGDYFRVVQAGSEGVTVKHMESGLRQEWDYRGLDSTRMEMFDVENTQFLEGDRVLLRKTDIDTGKTSNEAYRIQAINDNGQIVLEGKSGVRQINPGLNAQDRHIDLGYAVTSTGAQGASTRYDIGFMGTVGAEKRLTNSRAYYILISRAKEHAQIYTDNTAKLESILGVNREPKQTAHDMLHARKGADYAKNIAKYAQPLETYYAGRVLAESFGLDTGKTELQVLARTASAPMRVMLSAYDENGKVSGVNTWALAAARGEFSLGEQQTAAEDNTLFSIVQRGSTPEVLSADTLSDALSMAAKNPQASVILAPKGHEQHSVVLEVLDVDRITSVMIDEVTRFADESPEHTVNADDLPEPKQITADTAYDLPAENDTTDVQELDTDVPEYGDLPGPDDQPEFSDDWQDYSDMMDGDNTPPVPDTDLPETQAPLAPDTTLPELPESDVPELSLPDDETPTVPGLPDTALPELPELTDAGAPELSLPDVEYPVVPDVAADLPEVPELSDADMPELPVPEPEFPTAPDVGTDVPELPQLADTAMPELTLPDVEYPGIPGPADVVLPELPGADLPELTLPEQGMPEIRGLEAADLTLHADEISAPDAADLALPALDSREPDFSLPEAVPDTLDSITTLGPDERENYDPTLRHDLGEFELNKTIDKEI